MENFKDNLKIVIATIGKAELAKRLGISAETITRKIKYPGTWKLSEIEGVSEIYENVKNLPAK